MFFKEVENSEVSKIDVVTGYPVSADILRQQLADLLGMHLSHVAVHPKVGNQQRKKKKKTKSLF